MQQHRKFILGFTGIVLTGTLAFGAIASAAGDDDGARRRGRHELPRLTDEQKCEQSDAIDARVAALKEKLADRVVTLETRRAEADAAGDTELVASIDWRLARLDSWSSRLADRLATFDTWVVEHCDA
ncbi:MAG: hypothetical protein Q8M22_18355 [Actinomycetota bacterium]|nr:hypothetical protein [Actinomycetota bacterium]